MQDQLGIGDPTEQEDKGRGVHCYLGHVGTKYRSCEHQEELSLCVVPT